MSVYAWEVVVVPHRLFNELYNPDWIEVCQADNTHHLLVAYRATGEMLGDLVGWIDMFLLILRE